VQVGFIDAEKDYRKYLHKVGVMQLQTLKLNRLDAAQECDATEV